MSERSILAAAFVLAFELVAAAIGRARALLDSAVQAARRAYREACLA